MNKSQARKHAEKRFILVGSHEQTFPHHAFHVLVQLLQRSPGNAYASHHWLGRSQPISFFTPWLSYLSCLIRNRNLEEIRCFLCQGSAPRWPLFHFSDLSIFYLSLSYISIVRNFSFFFLPLSGFFGQPLDVSPPTTLARKKSQSAASNHGASVTVNPSTILHAQQPKNSNVISRSSP